jgi:hypothetical protein
MCPQRVSSASFSHFPTMTSSRSGSTKTSLRRSRAVSRAGTMCIRISSTSCRRRQARGIFSLTIAVESPSSHPTRMLRVCRLTPVHLDEAIKLASRISAHTRANEPTLAAIAESDLEEIFDDMRDDEENIMEEQQERVKPDDTWL